MLTDGRVLRRIGRKDRVFVTYFSALVAIIQGSSDKKLEIRRIVEEMTDNDQYDSECDKDVIIKLSMQRDKGQ